MFLRAAALSYNAIMEHAPVSYSIEFPGIEFTRVNVGDCSGTTSRELNECMISWRVL